ncbi:hypothetical protein D3C84_1009820 [compost metagenome]
MRGHADKVPLAGMPMLPPEGFRGRIGKALQLAQGFGKLRGVVLAVDDPVAPAILFQQGRG